MTRRTLIDFFADVTGNAATSAAPFLVYDDGYRTWTWSYGDLAAAAHTFAARLRAAAIAPGAHVVIWSENRPEWIAAMWGCLLEGVVMVPIDYRASAGFLEKVAAIVDAQAILVGDTVDAAAIPGRWAPWTLSEQFRTAAGVPEAILQAPAPDLDSGTTAEIIFTSGATAEPKGVVLTHRNILANIVPIEREMAKYRKYTIPFRPIRFLNLLPLSHMFGQAMATFVPPMLSGVVVFTRSYAPGDIIGQIKSRRVSVLVSVPKMLEVLKEHVLRVAPEAGDTPPPGMHWMKRWWKYRRIHRMFGFKFWAMVVGAAPLDPDLEAFWGRLGFVVVQGYGLTETAPIVTLNHPLRARRGAVGKPIAGVEVKIAADGEILVRGDNVTTGYFNAPEATRDAFEDGWFHTGDIGELDAEGQLHIRGRKKEMIVTPEGLNVFPEDVERAINEQPGVVDAAVVGAPVAGSTAERVQAILLLAPGTDPDAVVRAANATLGDHQKIRAAAIWPAAELPRTEGTRKLKRRELKTWLEQQRTGLAAAAEKTPGPNRRSVSDVLARFAPGRTLAPATTIDELGLTSLERVELMMALEEAFQTTIDETSFAPSTTVAQLETMVAPPDWGQTGVRLGSDGGQTTSAAAEITFPAWNRSLPVRAIRRASLPTWILPLAHIFARVKVTGVEHLAGLDGAAIFAANHQSHFDTPVILNALPPRWRYRVSPAMSKEFFDAHFFPTRHSRMAWFTNSLNYYLSSFFFFAFPLTQGSAGTRQTLRYIGELVEDEVSVLIFPEGRRNPTGSIGPFLPGVGMIAARLGVPVVPVRLTGLDTILAPNARWPTRGQASCAFGPPIMLTGNDYGALAERVRQAVLAL
ncbi:MAG TPA: AMP-binding protein [Vicinamibacterales bacterium]|jgi:long-chain acyl-CoA synthetase